LATRGPAAGGCSLLEERSRGSAERRPGRCGCAWCAPPRMLYRARPALACIIGARRAWTVEMISSEEIPCRYVPVVDRCECPSWRWISGSGIPSCRSSTAWACLSWWLCRRRHKLRTTV